MLSAQERQHRFKLGCPPPREALQPQHWTSTPSYARTYCGEPFPSAPKALLASRYPPARGRPQEQRQAPVLSTRTGTQQVPLLSEDMGEGRGGKGRERYKEKRGASTEV